MKKNVIIGIISILSFVSHGQNMGNIIVPEEMSKLNFLIGEWDCQVKTFNKAGKVVMKRDYFMTYEKQFNGMLIVATSGFIVEGEKSTLSQSKWLFFDKENDQFKQVNFDVVGNFHTYVGAFEKEDLILQFPKAKRGSDGVERTWRKKYTTISKSGFMVFYYYSVDDGKNWTIQWEQSYTRKS